MANVIVTGSGGLIGSEAVRHFIESGFDVIGLENDMRARFFGDSASTSDTTRRLVEDYPAQFRHVELDIRDREGIERCVAAAATGVGLAAIVHTAAQPSHDWAASDPHTDFSVNALGTLNLLEAARRHAPDTPFIFMSTNKVYGDLPNGLPLIDAGRRLELPVDHRWHGGIDTSMSIDGSMHSLFGVSKASADLMVQEYGRYFGMPTVCFRGGCLTGPSHRGAKLHGFLSYLMRCCMSGEPYTVFGYGGKQVRDNLHSRDVVGAFERFRQAPRAGAVYNLGGGRASNCSMLEAIALCEEISGRELSYSMVDQARAGDHRWWISDVSPFQRDYPGWEVTVGIRDILTEIHAVNAEAWIAPLVAR
jgi:CDP-paratose 2-epimerase